MRLFFKNQKNKKTELKQFARAGLCSATVPGSTARGQPHTLWTSVTHVFNVGTGPDAPSGSFRFRLAAPPELGVLTGGTTSQWETLPRLQDPAGPAGARVLSRGQCPACPSDGYSQILL